MGSSLISRDPELPHVLLERRRARAKIRRCHAEKTWTVKSHDYQEVMHSLLPGRVGRRPFYCAAVSRARPVSRSR